MKSASSGLIASTVRFLNDPTIKNRIKSIAGTVSFAFGVAAIIDIFRTLQTQQITLNSPPCYANWLQTADKVIIQSAKLSLILSGMVSKIGVAGLSALADRIMSKSKRERVFGANTTFAVNPWHPRHVVSIAAVLLALPSINRSAYEPINWAFKRVSGYPDVYLYHSCSNISWLSDSNVQMMTLFNTLTSRPVLHLGNLYFRKFR